MPAGFWINFDSKNITSDINDQGPYGGHRALSWQGTAGEFNAVRVIDFATRNGWKFRDSSRFTPVVVQAWKENGKAIFPLSTNGFQPSFNFSDSVSNAEYGYFPLSITTSIDGIRFETSWTMVQPGSGGVTDAVGYVVLNMDQDQMSVYHLWGE
jgi:hypothetical protein